MSYLPRVATRTANHSRGLTMFCLKKGDEGEKSQKATSVRRGKRKSRHKQGISVDLEVGGCRGFVPPRRGDVVGPRPD